MNVNDPNNEMNDNTTLEDVPVNENTTDTENVSAEENKAENIENEETKTEDTANEVEDEKNKTEDSTDNAENEEIPAEPELPELNDEQAKEILEKQEPEEPVLQTIIGFENSEEIMTELKKMIDEHGKNVMLHNYRFVGLVNDYLTDYERERRLILNASNIGLVKSMLRDKDRKIAVMRARSFIMDELFVVENAAEFILACYTYMFGWYYESPLRVREDAEEITEQEEEKPDNPILHLNPEYKVFSKLDAFKFRLTRKIIIPDGYTKLEDFCFDGNTWMRTITLPETVLAIGSYAFSACKHLKGMVLPQHIKRIEANVFSQCTDLAMVKIPKGVMEISDEAFSFCTNLKTIDIPNTVSSLGAEVFKCCSSLRKVYLPESVKFIDKDAFINCPNLTVYCYQNSYVHKYCIKNEVEVKTAAEGVDLHSIDVEEGEDE